MEPPPCCTTHLRGAEPEWRVFYSPPWAGRGLIAADGGVAGRAAGGVDRRAVLAEKRVAEDAVQPRSRVVENRRRVLQLGVPHAQRGQGGRGPARPTTEGL